MEEWITVQQAAQVRQCSDRHILRLIERKELEAKREGHRWLILKSSLGEESDLSPPESDIVSLLKAQLQEKDEQISSLQKQLEEKDKQIDNLQKQLEDASQRHDTIVLQITRQMEQSQRLLEYHEEPFYRRWFRKKRKEDLS